MIDETVGRDYEVLTLAAMIGSAAAIDDAIDAGLKGRDFHSPRHELIFDAILRLSNSGHPVSGVTVADALGSNLGRAGGAAYIAELSGRVDAIGSAVGFYVDRVRDASRRRRVVEVCTRTAAMMSNPDGDVDELVNAAASEVVALAEADVPEESTEVAAVSAMASLDRPVGHPTPWTQLTHTIGGWAPGQLYVIGARPSVGKTVLGMNALLDIARRCRDETALGFSMEMSRDELLLRMFSSIGSVDNEDITRRSLSDVAYRALAEASAQVGKLPLVIDDRTSLSLAQMRARIRAEKRKRPVSLVVVDYLNLIAPPNPRADRRVQVDAVAQGLKNLARDEDVPVIALAQLNRAIDGRHEKMPVLSDLRESGGIEAAADVVILMHRALNEEAGDTTELVLWEAKNRHGPQATIRLRFEGQFSRAMDRPWSPPLSVSAGRLDAPTDTRVKD